MRRDHIVSVRITDTGIGMSADAVMRLFGVFEQEDNSTTRRFGGSGLGLFISRQLARMMGGNISVDSWEDRGSTFTLTFRAQEVEIATAKHEAGPQVARTSLRGVKVLLTDDNAINRQVIKLFLAPHGCEIAEAANGKEALDKLERQPFDIVLLDVHMPVMDGRHTIGRIRASSEAWSGLPVIALTADAMSGDRERYLALGMTDYLSKPVDQRELIAKMTAGLGLAAAVPVAKTGTSAGSRPRGLRPVAVDDWQPCDILLTPRCQHSGSGAVARAGIRADIGLRLLGWAEKGRQRRLFRLCSCGGNRLAAPRTARL